jgi:transposase InsO family protein
MSKPVSGSPHVTPIESNAVHERVLIDLKDFSHFGSEMRYLMVVIDHYSGFVVTFCLPNKKASTIYEKFEQFMYIFGVPEIVHTDNGGEFAMYAILFRLIFIYSFCFNN